MLTNPHLPRRSTDKKPFRTRRALSALISMIFNVWDIGNSARSRRGSWAARDGTKNTPTIPSKGAPHVGSPVVSGVVLHPARMSQSNPELDIADRAAQGR